MGGVRKNADVVSVERKQRMKENYQANKADYNKRKILRELELNKRLTVKQETVDKYDWSAEQLTTINRYNTLYRTERTFARPIINLPEPMVYPRPQNPTEQYPEPEEITDRTYTQEMAETFFNNRTLNNGDKPKASTTKGILEKIPILLKLFGVQSSDLMEIYDKLTVPQITAKIESNSSVWKTTSTLKSYAGFGGLLAYDPIFRRIIGEQKTKELQAVYRKYRDEAKIETKSKKANVDFDYREMYWTMFDNADNWKKGTQAHAIAMLYTYGMYAKDMENARERNDDGNKLVICPRNYFHSVRIVKKESEMVNPKGNYYHPAKGRMVINAFKTSKFFSFDYILPKKAREGVNAYVLQNNNTWLIEKVQGGKYGDLNDFEGDDSRGGLAARVKSVMGFNIITMRPCVENYEVHALKEDRNEVANALAHSLITQEEQYLMKTPWEDTTNFVGKRVGIKMDEGRNKGKTVHGTVKLNDGSNPDTPPARRPYMVVFDAKFKEETEMVSFPDNDIQFLGQKPPPGARVPTAAELRAARTPPKAKPKSKPRKRKPKKSKNT